MNSAAFTAAVTSRPTPAGQARAATPDRRQHQGRCAARKE
jgi:hypothetical protein